MGIRGPLYSNNRNPYVICQRLHLILRIVMSQDHCIPFALLAPVSRLLCRTLHPPPHHNPMQYGTFPQNVNTADKTVVFSSVFLYDIKKEALYMNPILANMAARRSIRSFLPDTPPPYQPTKFWRLGEWPQRRQQASLSFLVIQSPIS